MSTYLDLTVLHNLPFSNANRDDAGLPKSVVYGGTQRGRLSSQSIKRAARYLDATPANGFANPTGYSRTTHAAHLVVDAAKAKGHDLDLATVASVLYGEGSPLGGLKKPKTGEPDKHIGTTLAVLTNGEISALADAFIAGEMVLDSKDKEGKKANAGIISRILKASDKRDIALWGRFFASADACTLDGAAQVAHAFTTHAVTMEDDFFTGMDDASELFSDHAGAGHPGDAYFLSGTFLKYANVNLDELVMNLAVDGMSAADVARAAEDNIEAFVRSLSLSVPQGKIRSTAHTTRPSFIEVTKRSAPVNPAPAFESPVRAKGGQSVTEESIERLRKLRAVDDFFGDTGETVEWAADTVDAPTSFRGFIEAVLDVARPDITKAVAKFVKE